MKLLLSGSVAIGLLGASHGASAQALAERVVEGCRSELDRHCSAVTPGEGRLLACLYAYEDKLSGECQLELYDAAVRLERAINALTYVASECRNDIQEQCAGLKVGEGRILQCLEDAGHQLSSPCSQALSDVGLRH